MGEREHHPSIRLLAVWRIRALLCTLFPSLICAALFRRQPVWWGVSTMVWAIVTLLLYYGYLPLRHRRLGWQVEDGWLRFRCGVLFERHQAVPIANIQYLSRSTPPLMRLYHLTSVVVHCAGGVLFLPGMSITQAMELQRKLMEEGGPGL